MRFASWWYVKGFYTAFVKTSAQCGLAENCLKRHLQFLRVCKAAFYRCISVGELAKHAHSITIPTNQQYSPVTKVVNNYLVWGTGVQWTGTEIDGHTAAFGTNSSGSDTAHNNIQPVRAAYCWRRTA